MDTPNNPITEVDLCAYVDGQLDIERQIEVEDYLCRHPEAAAELMADLRSRDAMRLALLDQRPPRSDLLAAARQLDRRLATRRIKRLIPLATFATLAAFCVWLAQDELSEVLVTPGRAAIPAFANEAVETHNVALVREEMTSQPKNTLIDSAAIKAATQIVFPRLADGWRILDTRLVPSDEGPGLEISLDPGLGVPLTFFAVRTTDTAPSLPKAIEYSGAAVAYWRKGDIGYALAGKLPPLELDRLAEDFADNPMD